MINIPGVHPAFIWLGFLLLIFIFLIIDLGIFNRREHALSVKEALVWSAVWFSLAMLFNLFVWYISGRVMALQFFTGYVIEKSLSVDNLFVMLLIFSSFKISPKHQHRVLFWGILGALLMRGLMIGLGVALVSAFHWILYIFGAFLIYGGIKLFFKKDDSFDPHDSRIVKLVRKVVKVSRNTSEGKFFIKEDGRYAVSILFIALVVIEITDIIFAFDSIPAIFGISTDAFIIFTSNIFAILGLRSLYFVILKAHRYFAYLPIGLAIILIFIGIKMIAEPFYDIPIFYSLGAIGMILFSFMLVSIFFPPKEGRESQKS